MTVKGSEVPEFVQGYLAKQDGKDLANHASRPWKRGWRAREMQEKYKRRFQERYAVA
jgi:hypothetical protein